MWRRQAHLLWPISPVSGRKDGTAGACTPMATCVDAVLRRHIPRTPSAHGSPGMTVRTHERRAYHSTCDGRGRRAIGSTHVNFTHRASPLSVTVCNEERIGGPLPSVTEGQGGGVEAEQQAGQRTTGAHSSQSVPPETNRNGN